MKRKVRFARDQKNFYPILTKEIDRYFNENGLPRHGGSGVVLKALVLIGCFLISFTSLLIFPMPLWTALILILVIALAKAGVAMSVMHDALHGAFSNRKWVNTLFGNSLYLLGGNPLNWKIQHNVYHHTYPNVFNVDEDISTKGLILRLSSEAGHRKINRLQHFYAGVLYSMMTLSFFVKDFRQLYRYLKEGDIEKQGKKPLKEFFRLVMMKLSYLFLMIGLPIFITNYTLGQVLIGFMLIHLIAGLVLSIVFQLAHIIDDLEDPVIQENGDIQSSWAIHQLCTTSNFDMSNKWLSWFVGGLNFQVEHHLFPNICHIHYPRLAPIVQRVARSFDLPYYYQPTLLSALRSHFRKLSQLGKEAM